MKKKVYVGISGGVDSAVSALLLMKQGYDVTGVFMKNWSDDFGLSDECPWEVDLDSARKVCDQLGIELKVYNFEKQYRDLVLENFYQEYALGNTPNPDILCNTFVKFDLFYRRCIEDGADYIATGHYASASDGKLYRPLDSVKDQTYFLSRISEEALRHTLFPLENLSKTEVREVAEKAELHNYDRKDSQGICFVGNVDITEFLAERIKETPGSIVSYDTGEVLGEHTGIWFYTLGQRKGLRIGGAGKPYFVCGKNVEKNELLVCQGRDHHALSSSFIRLKELTLINPNDKLDNYKELSMQIRHRGKAIKVVSMAESDKGLEINLDEKLWCPAPGQYGAFYSGNQVVGSGIIM